MPAPAVIPAPRAYINAVAVKGFVVELRAAKASVPSGPLVGAGPPPLRLVNTRTKDHGSASPRQRVRCTRGDARDSYCD